LAPILDLCFLPDPGTWKTFGRYFFMIISALFGLPRQQEIKIRLQTEVAKTKQQKGRDKFNAILRNFKYFCWKTLPLIKISWIGKTKNILRINCIPYLPMATY
jgi:hypothetical protein